MYVVMGARAGSKEGWECSPSHWLCLAISAFVFQGQLSATSVGYEDNELSSGSEVTLLWIPASVCTMGDN